MLDWDELARACGTDKSSAGHGYMEFYRQHCQGLEIGSLVELGIGAGASLQLWPQLFPEARVVGVDFWGHTQDFAGPRTHVEVLDVTHAATHRVLLEKYAPFDLVIDDANHDAWSVHQALTGLFPGVRPGGWYVIEDLLSGFPEGETALDGLIADTLQVPGYAGWLYEWVAGEPTAGELHFHPSRRDGQCIAFIGKVKP